jgi:DNA-binding NarL/FixJ family response regulator
MPIIAVVDDLIFRSKIEQAAAAGNAAVDVATNPEQLRTAAARTPDALILIDLNMQGRDALELVRTAREAAPSAPIIGYCSHTQTELHAQAKAAGCDEVLPRSALVQQLPRLVRDTAANP